MDLLERYLQAVGEYLPANMKADTLAELRENLLAQMEAREDELGRSLAPAEVASVLEKHGRPLLVAAVAPSPDLACASSRSATRRRTCRIFTFTGFGM